MPIKRLLLPVLMCLLILACSTPAALATPAPPPVSPPALPQSDGCPSCDGQPATRTPTAAAQDATVTAAPEPIKVTPPTAAGPAAAPHIELSASAAAIRRAETLTIRGQSVGIGLPYYYLFVQECPGGTCPADGQGKVQEIARGKYSGEVVASKEGKLPFELVSGKASMKEVVFTLRAVQPGQYQLYINATGEIKSPDGAFMMGGGGSKLVTISVK